ncbi:caspase family protein [bacterium]|nr:caspase family protein [bacterium]
MKIKTIAISLLLLIFVVFTGGCLQFMEELGSITSPSLEVDRSGDIIYHAVIVGIEDYQYITDLSYTIDDALDTQDVLVFYGNWDMGNIQLLTDGNASKSDIQSAITNMAKLADANDVCLFFFSGHGSRIPDDDGDEGNANLYDEVICPWDTTEDLKKETVISDDELGDWLVACQGNVVVILDTCMSGGFTKGIEETVKTVPNPRVPKDAIAKKHFGEGLVERLKQRPISRDLDKTGYVVLMACEEDKSAYESRRLKNGVFTYYIVEGFWGPADANSDNNVSAEEDFYYADPLVLKYKPTSQDPQLWDGYEGELLVVISSTSITDNMHVNSIEMSLKTAGINVNAIAIVTIVDSGGNPVEGATVSGYWSGATSDSDSGVTNVNGKVSLQSDKVRNPSSGTTFTFTVDGVTKDGWTYDSSANEKTSNSITI